MSQVINMSYLSPPTPCSTFFSLGSSAGSALDLNLAMIMLICCYFLLRLESLKWLPKFRNPLRNKNSTAPAKLGR